MRLKLLLIAITVSCSAYASYDVRLEKIRVNISDKAAIERGAKFYAINCMVCHTMKYTLYDPVSIKAGIVADKMPLNDEQWIGGAVPPDLSNIATEHSPSWLYTYLHSFYQDPKSITGYNNLLAPHVSMPNVLATLQGVQIRVPKSEVQGDRFYQQLRLIRSGSMDADVFNEKTKDLVTFLAYSADPHALVRREIGFWVLIWLAILFVFSYLLYQSYWKGKK